MKTILVMLFSVSTISLFGQDNTERFSFKTTNFNKDGSVIKISSDTIIGEQKLDIDFYKKYFSVPNYYPTPLVNSKYKDTSIVVWRDSLKEKGFISNWSYTTVYDRLSRVVKYSYSGCLICDQLPYNVIIFYDTTNRLARIEMRYGIEYKTANEKSMNSEDENLANDEYIMTYNVHGDIIQLKYLMFGILNLQIDKM